MSIEAVLADAIKTKLKLDNLILLGEQVYVCRECGAVSDYWKPGGVCDACELEAERIEDA